LGGLHKSKTKTLRVWGNFGKNWATPGTRSTLYTALLYRALLGPCIGPYLEPFFPFVGCPIFPLWVALFSLGYDIVIDEFLFLNLARAISMHPLLELGEPQTEAIKRKVSNGRAPLSTLATNPNVGPHLGPIRRYMGPSYRALPILGPHKGPIRALYRTLYQGPYQGPIRALFRALFWIR